jgi:hypothetical protein
MLVHQTGCSTRGTAPARVHILGAGAVALGSDKADAVHFVGGDIPGVGVSYTRSGDWLEDIATAH